MTDGYSPRTYRVVKLVADGRHAWLVVSSSLRDDDTWDVIRKTDTRTEAFDYVADVAERGRLLAVVAGCALRPRSVVVA